MRQPERLIFWHMVSAVIDAEELNMRYGIVFLLRTDEGHAGNALALGADSDISLSDTSSHSMFPCVVAVDLVQF